MTANKKWLLRFFSLLIALCILFVGTVITVDPFCYYRLTDRSYFANIFFLSAGMINHSDYETILIGSSMALHFDPSVVDEALNTHTLKICENGMNVTEIRNLLSACYEENRADRYIICLDMDYYRFTEPDDSKYPIYLLNSSKLDDYKYWFNFDVWTKYLPLDAAYILFKSGESVTESYKNIGVSKSTDGYGEEFAISKILANRPGPLTGQQRAELEAMIPNFDVTLNDYLAKFDKDREIILFLPPMSVGKWYLNSLNNSTDYFYKMRLHIAEAVAKYDNIKLYDFQSCDFTNDLSIYRDAIHYNYTINDFMSAEFAKPDYIATPESVASANDRITENVRQFEIQYADVLK